MTVPAVHCEARKIAYRQTKDGLVVSFVIHPNDMPDALAVAPLGQRYMLAMAMIGDDEQPIPARGGGRAGTIPELPSLAAGEEVSPDLKVPGARQLSDASQRGKERYANSTPMEQAVVRAARLPDDPRFIGWVNRKWGTRQGPPLDRRDAIAFIQERCCNNRSRGLIAEDQECYQRYLAMETEFRLYVGELAEPR